MCIEIKNSVRYGYEKLGVDNYYNLHAMDYTNPHYNEVKNLINYLILNYDIGENILDFCCGSGEVTLNLKKNMNVLGLDPFTYKLYETNTNRKCLVYDFKSVSNGKLNELNYKFDTIICSFGLHLCEESLLDNLLWNIGLISKYLVIITPHKRPDCAGVAWEEIGSHKVNKVTMKVYLSKLYGIY